MKAPLFLLLAALSGCAAQLAKPTYSVPPFDLAVHAGYRSQGPASIKGQAFLRQRGGGVVTCAGSEVIAFPATDYFHTIVNRLKAGYVLDGSSVGPDAKGTARRTTCDAQGNFTLDGMPVSTTWIVTTRVVWSAGYSTQGGVLLKEVTTEAERPTSVVLGDADLAR